MIAPTAAPAIPDEGEAWKADCIAIDKARNYWMGRALSAEAEIARLTAALGEAVVLTSQLVSNADGFEVHGIFPSFHAAGLHVVKDADLGPLAERRLLALWGGADRLYEYVGPGPDGRPTHWCASKQPIRCEDGCSIRPAGGPSHD